MTDQTTRRPARKPRAAKPEAESPRVRAILDDRTRRLSRAESPEAARTPRAQILVCRVGENLFGIPAHEVSRLRVLERLSGGGPGLAGLVAESGRVRQVLDFASLVGAPSGSGGGFLAVLTHHPDIALRLNERPDVADVEPTAESRARVLSAGAHKDKTLVILSVAELLAGGAPMGA